MLLIGYVIFIGFITITEVKHIHISFPHPFRHKMD